MLEYRTVFEYADPENKDVPNVNALAKEDFQVCEVIAAGQTAHGQPVLMFLMCRRKVWTQEDKDPKVERRPIGMVSK